MKKELAKEHILKKIEAEDTLVGFFYAQVPFKIWLILLIGPLAVFSMKTYFVGVTKKGIHFHRLNLLGKFTDHDFFAFDEIERVAIGKGMLQRPMRYQFKNGRSLYLKAQLKGVDSLAKLDDVTQKHIDDNIQVQ